MLLHERREYAGVHLARIDEDVALGDEEGAAAVAEHDAASSWASPSAMQEVAADEDGAFGGAVGLVDSDGILRIALVEDVSAGVTADLVARAENLIELHVLPVVRRTAHVEEAVVCDGYLGDSCSVYPSSGVLHRVSSNYDGRGSRDVDSIQSRVHDQTVLYPHILTCYNQDSI